MMLTRAGRMLDKSRDDVDKSREDVDKDISTHTGTDTSQPAPAGCQRY